MVEEIAAEVFVQGATELAGQFGFEAAVEAGTEALARDEPQNSWRRFWIKLAVLVVLCGALFVGAGFYSGEWPTW
jgi:hypothetical protein